MQVAKTMGSLAIEGIMVRTTLHFCWIQMATISKLCVMLALNDPAPQLLSQEKVAAHSMQFKPLSWVLCVSMRQIQSLLGKMAKVQT